MGEHLLEIPGAELVGLLPNESPTLCLIAGAKITHQLRGVGSVLRVELRGTYAPLIHISFVAGDAAIPLDILANGRFSVELDSAVLQVLRDESDSICAAKLENDRRTEEVRRRHEEDVARIREQLRLEQEREYEELLRQKAEASIVLRESLPERHQERIEGLGLEYRGIRAITRARSRRITHCWSCKDGLDNAVDVECAVCGWILCTCSACGCGYEQSPKLM